MDPAHRLGAGPVEQSMLRWARPVVVGVLFVVLIGSSRREAQVGGHDVDLRVLITLAVLVAVCSVLIIGNRVRRPMFLLLFALLVLCSITLVYFESGGPGFLGVCVAASVTASRRPRRQSTVLVAIALGALGAAAIAATNRSLESVVLTELGTAAFYALGVYSKRLRERTEQADRLLIEVERNRAAQARSIALAERQRLAREMHDVLAHSLSGLLLHIESAKLLAEHDPSDPRLVETLDRANHLGHTGLDEARQAIGMLRNEDLPGPDRLPELVDRFQRERGVRAHLVTSGRPAGLSSESQLALYRVAQEALTNIGKHAEPEHVEVSLCYEPTRVRLVIEDVGRPRARANTDGGGYGLSGMRERAELLGGGLSAVPTESGFRVELWVPAT